jgi:hypothetical protein
MGSILSSVVWALYAQATNKKNASRRNPATGALSALSLFFTLQHYRLPVTEAQFCSGNRYL